MIFTADQMKHRVMARHIAVGSLPPKQEGVTYLLVLSLVVFLLLSLGKTSEHSLLSAQREKEAELLFIGQQYKIAIASYYKQSPNGINEFPLTLQSLVDDRRSLIYNHHLRRLYKDPITNGGQWGLIKNDSDQITGVYSLSTDKPLTINLASLGIDATKVQTYADIKFKFTPSNVVDEDMDEGEDEGDSD